MTLLLEGLRKQMSLKMPKTLNNSNELSASPYTSKPAAACSATDAVAVEECMQVAEGLDTHRDLLQSGPSSPHAKQDDQFRCSGESNEVSMIPNRFFKERFLM